MDTTDPDIEFDDDGVCNYCNEAKLKLPKYRFTPEEQAKNLEVLKSRIKARQRGEYDSILGLSGGVDSSYVAYLAKEIGLNPLCVHFDNGWNSDVAVKNIRNIIDNTDFDLYTYVIDWPEFRDLQRSFFKAGVIDIEMLTDHAIFASLFKIRKEHKITTVLSGTNYATEHGLPPAWSWPKMDLRNIKSIQNKYGEMNLKSFPTMSTFSWILMKRFNLGGFFEEPLNQVNYHKNDVMKVLANKFSWQYYGGKHYESVFTKFYQAYILPTKFNVDKRKSHLSALIRNGEITREDAINQLSDPLYHDHELQRDSEFVLKKLGFSADEFQKIMRQLPVPHDSYSTDQSYIQPLVNIGRSILGSRKE